MIAMIMRHCIVIVLDILCKHAPGPGTVDLYLNLNSLLVICQNDNPSSGPVTGGNVSLAFTREVNLDTLSSDYSEEETGESPIFHSLIVRGKKLFL